MGVSPCSTSPGGVDRQTNRRTDRHTDSRGRILAESSTELTKTSQQQQLSILLLTSHLSDHGFNHMSRLRYVVVVIARTINLYQSRDLRNERTRNADRFEDHPSQIGVVI